MDNKFLLLSQLPKIVENIFNMIITAITNMFKVPPAENKPPQELVEAMKERFAKDLGFNSFKELGEELKQLRVLIKNTNDRIAGLTVNEDFISKIAAESNRYNSEMRKRGDMIFQILIAQGVTQDELKDANRQIWNVIRLHLMNKESIDHMDKFVEREQANGNLPIATAPVQVIPPDEHPATEPTQVLPRDKDKVMAEIQKFLKPDALDKNKKVIERIASTFATRKDKTRTFDELTTILINKIDRDDLLQ